MCLFRIDNPLHDFSKSLVYNRLYIRSALPVNKKDVIPLNTRACSDSSTAHNFGTIDILVVLRFFFGKKLLTLW